MKKLLFITSSILTILTASAQTPNSVDTLHVFICECYRSSNDLPKVVNSQLAYLNKDWRIDLPASFLFMAQPAMQSIDDCLLSPPTKFNSRVLNSAAEMRRLYDGFSEHLIDFSPEKALVVHLYLSETYLQRLKKYHALIKLVQNIGTALSWWADKGNLGVTTKLYVPHKSLHQDWLSSISNPTPSTLFPNVLEIVPFKH